MILKIFKAVWFLSLMGFMALFMYIYASLPETVTLRQGAQTMTLSRDTLFYLTLITVSLINMLVFVVSRLSARHNDALSSWFFGQVITLNLFFATTLGLINLINSGESFTYSRLGPAVYGSLALVVMWALSWPLYSFSRKYFSKPVV